MSPRVRLGRDRRSRTAQGSLCHQRRPPSRRPILGGRITGAEEAEIHPGGADWQIVRPDGTIEIDGCYSARTSDGGPLLLHAKRLRTGTPDVLEQLGRGNDVDPSSYYFRTTVQIETAAPVLAHLQRALFVSAAQRQADSVRYRAYRVG